MRAFLHEIIDSSSSPSVLHFGRVHSYGDLSGWDFRVWGEVEQPFALNWAEFRQMPVAEETLDIHCVTRWSKLDTRWEGVAFSHIADVAQPTAAARFVIFHAEGGFTANIPLTTAMAPGCILAWSYDGTPLDPDHRLPAARDRPPDVLLEEREVASRRRVHGR